MNEFTFTHINFKKKDMQNLQVYGVQELNAKDAREIDGGFFTLFAKLVARTASIWNYKTEIKQGLDSISSAFRKLG